MNSVATTSAESSPSRSSIRGGSPTPHAGSPVPQEEDTFTSMLSISVDAPIGSMSIISLYSPLFLRATFSFPKRYPAASAPSIELERSADFSLKQRATLLQGVRKLMASRSERGLPSLEAALRYLLGDRSFDRIEEDDDDEAEEALEGSTLNVLPPALLRNNVNVPPPRRGGATFGPSGQLVVFFPTNVFATSPVDKDNPSTPPNEPDTQGSKFPMRLSEAFGNLPSESPEYEGNYQETDEALLMTSGRSYRAVEGFEPACPNSYTSEGGPGIASVLAATLQRNDHKIRTASRRSPGPAHSRSVPGDDSEHDRMRRMSRSGRRRSSVVAAAITATLLSSSRPKSIGSQSTRSSPTALKFSVSPVKISFESAAQGQAAHDDPQILALPPAPGTPLDGTSSSSQWSEQTQGVLTPHLDWASEPMPEFDQLFPNVDGRTLNQAFVECSSVEAAKAIVRSREGTRLRDRPIHVAMSSQTELLTTP
ncbi:hypothetical protein JCM3766R1_004377 [Sporobolomyces carnicolor]